MKHPIPLFFSLLLLSIPGLVYSQPINPVPVPGQESGGTSNFFTCGASQFEIECLSNGLTVIGTDNADRIQIVCDGDVPYACVRSWAGLRYTLTLKVDPERACPGVTAINILGEGGDDRINASANCSGVANQYLFGGPGHDKIKGNDGPDIIQGGAGADHLFGNDGRDHIYGEGGADRINAGFGNDNVEGGAGNDEIFGDPTANVVVDHRYNSDHLNEDDGNGCLVGVAGEDTLSGGNGNDHLSGGYRLYGEGGNDRLTLTYCSPVIAREGGDEDIEETVILPRDVEGGLGNDRLLGSVCEENLMGDEGNDFLYMAIVIEPGTLGDHMVNGGEGDDIVIAYSFDSVVEAEHNYVPGYSCPAGEAFCDLSFYRPRACLEPVW